MKKIVSLSLLVVLLAACSSKFATNGEKLYMTSQNGPGVKVPPPLSEANISPFYNLPTQENRNLGVSIKPPIVSIEDSPDSKA